MAHVQVEFLGHHQCEVVAVVIEQVIGVAYIILWRTDELLLERFDYFAIELIEGIIDVAQQHLLLESVRACAGLHLRDACIRASPSVEHVLDASEVTMNVQYLNGRVVESQTHPPAHQVAAVAEAVDVEVHGGRCFGYLRAH